MTDTVYMRLFEILVDHGDDFTISELVSVYSLNENSTRQAIAKLQRLNMVVPTGEINGRDKVYVIANQASSGVDGKDPEEIFARLMRHRRYENFTFKKPQVFASWC